MSINVLTVRRQEVKGEVSRLESRLVELRKELEEIDMAERVLARYSGEAGASPRSQDQSSEEGASGGKPEGTPTVPEMITEILRVARAEGEPALAPKEIADRIRARWWPTLKSDHIASIAWRMRKRDDLVNVGGGRYSLPETTEAADHAPGEEQSAASEPSTLWSAPNPQAGT